ncbi:antiphagocytic M protein, type 3 [Streptococcus dysgalactiae subsp. equisimilis]|nr:M protein [Streptococcus dysgalactiae]VTS15493.1 antiphagocytic M protein, type 3 [Streptococcus dysgalactiae subsp. equisimilis]
MARENTNKHYSLRKLKTGTASVAVALTVLGAGLASQTEVKAEENTQVYDQWVEKREEARADSLDNDLRQLESKVRNLRTMMYELWNLKLDSKSKKLPTKDYANYLKELNDHFEKYLDEASGVDYKKLLGKTLLQEKELKDELQKLADELDRTSTDLKNKQEEYDIAIQGHALREREHQQFIDNIAKVLMDKEDQKHLLEEELAETNSKKDLLAEQLAQKEKELANEKLAKEGIIDSTYDYVTEKESEIAKLKEEIQTNKSQLESLNSKLAEQTSEIDNLKQELTRKENMYESFLNQAKENLASKEQELAKLKQLETINNNLLGNAKDMIAKLSAKNEQLASDKAKLEEQNKISEASRQGLRRDLNASREAKKQLEAEHQKLEEQNKISEASRKGLRRDLDASREAKKQVEKDLANLTAELDKVKEEKQISDASRKGLRRDLDASREAKKQVEKALEEANSKLAALEKLNKELEESKKLTEKEKAELQAKLEAEAKALKEKLAKQAEELAKLRAGKASDSQTPDAKPGNKAVPGKGQAPQAGTKPNQNKEPMKETKRQLPSTGEATNPFFTAAALAVMATAGVAAVAKRKEEN